MTGLMQHTDDAGELSLFISGNELLFACNQGHAWRAPLLVVTADVDQSDAELESVRVLGSEGLEHLTDKFGPGVADAMGFG